MTRPCVVPVDTLCTDRNLRLPAGSLFAFPTDTVYGVGARVFDDIAVRALRALKSRPRPAPLTLHVGSVNDIKTFCLALSEEKATWLKLLLPGPYTVLLHASSRAPRDAVLDGKVGLRVPGGTAFQRVYACFGPILGSSANRHGNQPLNDPDAILAEFSQDLHTVIVSEETPSGRSSSIVDLTFNQPLAVRGALPEGLTQALREER